MRKLPASLLVYALTLAACSRSPSPPDTIPAPLPPVRKIIAANKATLFTDSTKPQNILVGGIRRFEFPGGSEFGACVKATVTSMSGGERNVTFVIIVSNEQILDRRRALPDDDCENEAFTPL